MKSSISVANYTVPMPQIMFQGELDSVFKTVSEMGYQGVELFLQTADGADVKGIKDLLARHRLEVSMAVAVTDLVRKGLSLGHPDPSVRKEFLDRAPAHLKLASELGAMVPVGFTRGAVPPGIKRDDVQGWFIESLASYHRMAHDLGVTLILEPINRYEINYINRADEALEIVEQLRLPNLGLLLDSFHMNIEETSIPLAIWKAREHIVHFHFVDSNRRPPGYGHSNMKEIYLCLKEIGYSGFLGVEAAPGPDPAAEARAGIQYIRMLEHTA